MSAGAGAVPQRAPPQRRTATPTPAHQRRACLPAPAAAPVGCRGAWAASAAPPAASLPAGHVFRSRMEGSALGVLESWRYMHGSCMAVRTALRPARGGPRGACAGRGAGRAQAEAAAAAMCSLRCVQPATLPRRLLCLLPSSCPPTHPPTPLFQAVMFWFFDRMETLQRHVAAGGFGQRSLRQQIESGAPPAALTEHPPHTPSPTPPAALLTRPPAALLTTPPPTHTHLTPHPPTRLPPAAPSQTSGGCRRRRRRTQHTYRTSCWTGSAGSRPPTSSST